MLILTLKISLQKSQRVLSCPLVDTSRTCAAVRDAGVVRQQEQRSQELLHVHHGLRQVLQVHVRHFGGLRAGDAVVMLHLRHGPPERPQFFQGPLFRHGSIGKANGVAGEQNLGRVQLRAGPSGDSFQDVPGGVKAGPGLVRFCDEDKIVLT